jgi:surface polysaccharide O-acyltransferase-like enzyme
MLLKAIFIELTAFTVFNLLIFNLLKEFGVRKSKAIIFLVPLFIFMSGFLLRLTGNKEHMDIGFLLTDSSAVFITILFTLCLYLGQVRYWKMKRTE